MFVVLIIAISLIFAAGCFGVLKLFSSNFSDNEANQELALPKIKSASIIFLILNVYSLIQTVNSIAKRYAFFEGTNDIEGELGRVFVCIFSLLIVLVSIMQVIFLLKKKLGCVIAVSTTIIVLQLFNVIFVDTIDVYTSYFLLLPSIVTLVLFRMALLCLKGESKYFCYAKLFKIAPYFTLLKFLSNVFILKSTPIVGTKVSFQISSTNLRNKDDFPTLLFPKRSTLKINS